MSVSVAARGTFYDRAAARVIILLMRRPSRAFLAAQPLTHLISVFSAKS